MEMIHHHPACTPEHWGDIPYWLSEGNPKSAKEQLNDGYRFGGWQPFSGFTLLPNDSLYYPGDPALKPYSEIKFRDERVLLYPSSWVAVIQPDRSFEVCRMD